MRHRLQETRHRTFYHDRWRTRPSRAGVVSAVLSRHVAIVLLPIMIVTVAVALEARPILGLLTWAYPAGLLLAVLWTRAWFTSTVGAVLTRPDAVAVLTFADLASNAAPAWQRLTDVRFDDESLNITVGLSPYRLVSNEWNSFDVLCSAVDTTYQNSRTGQRPSRGHDS